MICILSSGSLNDTLPARWVYQYRLYGKERFFQTPKDYRKNPSRQFHKPSKEVEQDLELKVKHLEMELEYKKTYSLSSKTGTNKQKYQVVKELRRKYVLKDLLLISRLPKSVYYYYEQHNETDIYHDIKILISEIFESSNKKYGYRRIKLALQNFYQIKIAYKTVVRLMKGLHIVCKVRKKRYRYISQISNKITPNLLKRDFKKDEPNIAWVTDVSEFRFNRKRLYLSVVQDLYNDEVKAYQISRSQNQDLILKTLKKAINPNEDLSKLLIHSDQGILYQSPKYRNYLKKSSFVQSMSAKGNAYKCQWLKVSSGHLNARPYIYKRLNHYLIS